MAKVPYSKLKCKINEEEVQVKFGEETIVVKQYLPISDKLQLIGRVVELAHGQDYNFHNPVKAKVYEDLEVLFAYTNLTFTEKQKEDLPKLYDILQSNGIFEIVYAHIPEVERQIIHNGILETVVAVYQYQNSINCKYSLSVSSTL